MIYFRNTTDFYMAGPTAVTLGKFDGVHRGHQKLIREILEQGNEGLSSVVFTLNAREEDKILTDAEQKQVLDDMGISCLIRCPFIPEISHLSPETFVKEILVDRLHVKYAAVGTDFRFGFQRRGDAPFLKECGERFGFQTQIIEKEAYNGREISSTYIREALQDGDVELAAALLGRSYSISGNVIHGQGLGTRIGVPTCNFIPPAGKLLPRKGVYATTTLLPGGERVPSITNIGTKPTVDGSTMGVETFLYDVNVNLYGQVIRVVFDRFIRPEQKFASVEELQNRIRLDIASLGG